MANTKLALILGLAVVGTVAAFLIFNGASQTNFKKLKLKLADDDKLETLYTEWKFQYGKTYGGAENQLRFNIFAANYHRVQIHNAQNFTWTLGLNQFSDLTSEEFRSIFLGYNADAKNETTENVFTAEKVNVTDLPATVDWRQKGAVTPVKNQGQCGSCWAFSTTGALEGRNFLANGKLVSLSEQELVDCSGAYGNQGCNGGLMDNAFKYVAAKGITTEEAYPYRAVQGRCQTYTSAVKNRAFTDVQKTPVALQAAVAQGPVAIAIEADQYAFQAYKGGVISTGCGTNLDHGVLVVGYGTENGVDYWIVKNSWGNTWGEQGYVRIARGTQNRGAGECGINTSASFPTF